MAEDISRTIVELTAALDAERRRWTEAEPHVKRGRFFDAIFRDMLDGVSIVDPQGALLDVNPAFCVMTGFDRADMVGATPPYPHWPPEERETNQDVLERAMRGELRSTRMTLWRKDGARFRALLTPSVVRRDDGSTIAIFATFKDLTEHELDQQALRESEELHRSIVAAAQEAILVRDSSGRTVAWNDATTRIFGFDDVTMSRTHDITEIPGWHAVRADGSPLPPEELPSQIALATGRAQVGYVVGVVRGGEVRWIEGCATPLVADGEESPHAVVVICSDVTERRRAEEALRASEAMRDATERLTGSACLTLHVDTGRATLSRGVWHLFDLDDAPADSQEFGKRAESLMNRVHPDDRNHTWNALRDYLAGAPAPVDFRIVHRDGSVHTLHAEPFAADGDPQGSITVHIADVTGRRRAEAEIESLTRMRDTAEQASRVGSIRYDFGTRRALCSHGLLALFDVDPDGFDGDIEPVVSSRVHPDDRRALREMIVDAAETGEVRSLDYRVIWRDESVHVVHGVGVVEKDASGRPVALTGSFLEVTERRRAESEIAGLMRMRDTAERAGRVGSIRTDFRSGRASWTAGMATLLDLDTGETEGDPGAVIDSAVHPDDRAAVREALAAAAVTGQATPLEFRVITRDGSERLLHGEGVVEKDERGDSIAVTGSYQDVTELRAAEDEVRRLNAELAGRVLTATEQRDALNRELEAFAYSIAHDVRAPLRVIDGFSAVVMEDEIDGLSPEGVVKLRRVRQAAQRLARLLDDLMGLSRVSRRDLQRQPVDISRVAVEVAEELSANQPTRVVDLVVQPGLVAQADPALLRLALRELLDNAWKFTWPHESARIEVGAADTGGERAFFVRDDGVGFDLRHAEHLFGAFQRMHPEDEFPGEGIGLATVQRLVRRHGGRVWAEAAVEQGATFFFTLPDGGGAADSGGAPPAG